jgi:putative hydrolase of the HAD superfamily
MNSMATADSITDDEPKRLSPWIIFDADNTLWDVESLYENARHELAGLLQGFGTAPEETIRFQEAHDVFLHAKLGYSAQRFPQSFEDTIRHFVQNPANELVDRARSIAQNVFRSAGVVFPNVKEILDEYAPRYRLGLITAGEIWVQEARISEFAHAGLFSAIVIVPRKNASTFDSFASANLVDRQKSWVVGDSVVSDIIPANSAGLNAVLVRHRNWSRVEDAKLPAGVTSVPTLREVSNIIPRDP